MNSLDSLTRAGLAGSVPSADVLPLVNQGLESIRQLIAQGDTKGADTVLEFLNRLLRQRFSADATGTTTPEPFTLPHPYGIGPSLQDVQAAFAAPVGDVSPSPTGSEVPAGLESRIEGLPQNIATALRPGTKEWTTVMTALQQHEDLHYDADSQRFFTTVSDGSKVDLCSVYDVQDIMEQNSAFTGNEAGAIGPVSDFIKQKIDEASSRPFAASNTLAILAGHPPQTPDPSRMTMETFHSQVDALKRKLADLEAALQVLSAPSQVAKTVVS